MSKFFFTRKTKFTSIFTWTAIETIIVTWTRCKTFKISTSTFRNATDILTTLNHTLFFNSRRLFPGLNHYYFLDRSLRSPETDRYRPSGTGRPVQADHWRPELIGRLNPTSVYERNLEHYYPLYNL